MNRKNETRDGKGRTCRDRLRYQRQQRKRRGDPASSVFLRLLALVLALFGRAPFLAVPASRLAPTQGSPLREREDVSPQQRQRERGEGGYGHLRPAPGSRPRRHGRYRSKPSYRRLVADLRRPSPAARDEAAAVLRRRLPPEAHEWFDEVVKRRDWSALAWCARPDATDEQTETAMLRAALDWTEARKPDGGGGDSPPPPGDDDDGPSGRTP